MKIKILPSSPLSPLNQLFPEGVPILDGVELSLQGTNAYLFDSEGIDQGFMSQVVAVATANEMPATIALIFMCDGQLIIPRRWVVCTNELNSTAS